MRRVFLGTLDQALSSASNVLFVLSLARILPAPDFGVYALVYTGLAATLAVFRGIIGTPLTLKAGNSNDVLSEATRALAATLLCSIPLSLFMIALSVAWDIHVHPLIFTAIPVLLVQDLARLAALAIGRVETAVLGDGLWFTASLSLMAATWVGWNFSAGTACGVWVASGSLSALLLLIRLNIFPEFRDMRRVLGKDAGDRFRFGAEGSVSALGSLAVTAAVTALISPLASAALRGAGTIVGPINVLLSALQVAVVPELRRRNTLTYLKASRITGPVVGMTAMLALSVVAIGLWAPSNLGELFLGESWVVVAPILTIVGIEYLGQAALANATCILRARGLSRSLLTARLVLTFGQVCAGVSAALAFGTATAVALASAAVVWVVAIGVNAALLARDSAPTPEGMPNT